MKLTAIIKVTDVYMVDFEADDYESGEKMAEAFRLTHIFKEKYLENTRKAITIVDQLEEK